MIMEFCVCVGGNSKNYLKHFWGLLKPHTQKYMKAHIML